MKPLPILTHRCFAAATLLLLAASVHAQTTVAAALSNFGSEVRNYNLVTLSTTAGSSLGVSTQGPLAIRGNLTLSGGTIASQSSLFGLDGDPTLFVGGTLALNGTTTLGSGYASIATANASNFTWNASTHDLSANNSSGDLNTTSAQGSESNSGLNPLGSPAPANWSWTGVANALSTDSYHLSVATTTGTISVSGGSLTFTPNATPTAGSMVVFSLNDSLFKGSTYNGSAVNSLIIDIPDDVDYVINVVSATNASVPFLNGLTFANGPNDASNIFWNFEGTGNVTLGSTAFYGTILAPDVTLSTDSTVATVDGQIAAESFSDSQSQLGFTEFDQAVLLPESGSWGIGGIGLCVLAIAARWYPAGSRKSIATALAD
jgi:choice-of-anchor A domain-containing protein